jgi:uncharacterized surface protein with fasciclin (FAS1) repeats
MRWLGRLEGIVLVATGAGAGWLALLGEYELLLNPTYRWLTASGAAVTLAMGLVALALPRSRPSPVSLVVYLALLGLVVAGRPHERGESSLMVPPPPPPDLPTVIDGVEHEPIDLDDLHRTVEERSGELVDRPLLVYGIALRVPALAEEGHFALVRPVMACCVADAILVGFRTELGPGIELPEGEAWINVYGRLRRTPEVLPARSFRLGTVRFAMLDERHVFVSTRVTPFTGFQPKETLVDRLESGRYAAFLHAVEKTGWRDRLVSGGPYTVLAPVDQAFEALPPAERKALFEDEARLRTFVEDHVIPGRFDTPALLEVESLAAASGRTLPVTLVNGKFRIAESRLLFKNVGASNGVLHAIYPVLRR